METPSASYEGCEYLFAQFYEGLLGLQREALEKFEVRAFGHRAGSVYEGIEALQQRAQVLLRTIKPLPHSLVEP